VGLELRHDMLLEMREGGECVVLRKRAAETPGSPAFCLHPLQGLVLALCDGTRTAGQLRETVLEAIHRSAAEADALVSAVQSRFRQFLAEGDSEPSPAWNEGDFAAALTSSFHPELREAAPRALLWVVTECCNKRCRYCYKDAVFVGEGEATDLGLSFERLRELAREAQEIGVTTLVITGGEPFLRPDLIEVIGLFVARGIDVVPITKSRIVGERMQALKATGLKELHVSLDSHRAEAVDFLAGVDGAFAQMADTLAAAAEHGLPVVLRPTLTSRNVRDLIGLVELARGLGVRRFLMDTYGESCGRHEESFLLSPEDNAWLRAAAGELRERFPDMDVGLKFDRPAGPKHGRGCVEGARGMTLLPDGRATKCEHWRKGDELIFGDLREQSIMAAWSSPALQRINFGPRELYAGTICQHCKKFDLCNERRGRCSQSSLLRHGTPFAPDVYCPLGAHRKARIGT